MLIPNTIYQGNALNTMQGFPDESVHCIVTSPPYWGLRDYGHSEQLGQEKTPEEFVSNLVTMLREAKRVLRKDGTLWLNLGDSYCSTAPGTKADPLRQEGILQGVSDRRANANEVHRKETPTGMKPKDLVGIPWMVAFALRADGWYLRQDIIWNKPNPMPESVTDRCTKAHEYIFLLSKSNKYYYDAEAIRVPLADASIARLAQEIEDQKGSDRVPGKTNGAMKAVGPRFGGNKYGDDDSDQSRTKSGNVWNPTKAFKKNEAGSGINNVGRSGYFDGNGELMVRPTANKKSVWTVTTKPYKEAHFATFPPDLIRPCILAGCPVGGIVLDPFGGSGTTAQVAIEEGRQFVLCELNEKYISIAKKRIASIQTKLLIA